MTATSRSGGDRSIGVDSTKPDGLPIPPIALSQQALTKWKILLDQLPTQSLRRIDQHQLGILSELLALFDSLSAVVANNCTDHKSARLLINTAAHVHKLSAAFGLTIADRSRLKIEPEKEPSAFDDWMRRQGAES